MRSIPLRLAATTLGLCSALAHAAPTGIDGVVGAEYGAATATVLFNPAAPQSNFGTPTNQNHNVAYSIYVRADADYLYGAVVADGNTNGLNFANIYLNTDYALGPGSDLGFEVGNDRFFIPTTGAAQNDTANYLFAFVGNGVVEFAVDFDLLVNDPYGMGFNRSTPGNKIAIWLSQSFGYSVAGGATYGPDRLGAVVVPNAVPEPGGLALLALAGVAGIAASRRKR